MRPSDVLAAADLSDVQKYLSLHRLVSGSSEQDASTIDAAIQLFLDEADQANTELTHLLTLIRIEIALSFSPSEDVVDNLFNSINSSSEFNKQTGDLSNTSKVIKIVYNDLLTDYQYLFKTITKNYKLIDLVNKKIVLLGNFAGWKDQDLQAIGGEIYKRVVEYLLISSYDFRKQNLFNHLNEELGILDRNFKLEPAALAMFEMSSKRQNFIPFDQFTQFVNNCSRFIHQLDHNKLVEFYIENNLSLLPLFYKSITIGKIPQLFKSPSNVAYEKLISKMITNHNLPFGTVIDQERQLVTFPDTVKDYDAYDSKVHNIFKLVVFIADQIEA